MATTSENIECRESTLRRRHKGETLSLAEQSENSKSETVQQNEKYDKKEKVRLGTGTYWLTRIVLLRCIACMYFIAFTVAYNQNKQLIGEKGLTPCKDYLRSVKRYVGGKIGMAALTYAPTILWFLDWEDMNGNLDGIALVGLALSGFVLLLGSANMIIMAVLWILYHSIVNVGQLWYSFGWESQLLETGFLCIFLCPLWSLAQIPHNCPPSLISIWSFRWLIVRIMLGAGMIKIRGDRCWRDLTCMDYHYEVVLIISGNLSFLNWLTIVPSIACFDDAALAFLFWPVQQTKRTLLKLQNEEAAGQTATKGMLIRRVVNVAFGILIAYLSVPVVINLLSPRQVMNTSFEPLRIVNTYGAFGSITKERTEVVFQGTLNATHSDEGVVWEEYEFLCKPGALDRRPCLISPYHYRLDWLMWFAAFQTYEQNEWIIQIAGRLLANDSTVLSLMDHNPFQGKDKPRYSHYYRWIRGEHFRYKFTKPGSASAAKGKWWVRRRIGPYFPPVNLEGLRKYFRSRNWPQPDV
ncbi:hypothetical protein QTP70_021447 [Hemibagrus guttatus]|uniref:Lipase maturation factor n=1 Tax=Hemibagrus guttatus TaxID=175788 RepID=A0AAE0QR40_9TELE|nr:hypothetical protein QTP70_021447 [Hemibagrus guttatus]